MKTFGFFMIMFLASLLITLNIIFKGASTDEMLKFIFAQQFAFIMYKLIKEEDK